MRLGSYVLLRAAHEAARWQRELPRDENPLFVSVNISSRQMFRQNLIQEIRHILGRNIVPKGSLRLEITESLVMENPEQATEILEWLRGAGAELALDDFGTGYSSLAYLQRFPFDTIKIDRALVQSSSSSTGASSAIVRSMVALAHELDKKVVAEGVESSEDVGFLRSIGCHYAQGFYYGEPMSDREVTQLLKMVRTAEHKLRPRGLFLAKPKPNQKQKQKSKKAANAPAAQASQAALPPPRPDGARAARPPTAGHTPPRIPPPNKAPPHDRPPAAEPGEQGPGALQDRTVRPRPRSPSPPPRQGIAAPVPPIPPAATIPPLPQQHSAAKPPASGRDVKEPGMASPIRPAPSAPPLRPQAGAVAKGPAAGPSCDAGPPAIEAVPPPLPPVPPQVAGAPAPPLPPSPASAPQSNGEGASRETEDTGVPDPALVAAALRLSPKAPPVAPAPVEMDQPTQPNLPPRPTPPAATRTSAADFSGLPPHMAASLAKLAGVPWPSKPDGNSEKGEEPKEESVGTTPPGPKQMTPK